MARGLGHTTQRVLGGALLVATSPILALIALVVRVTAGRPVLFKHVRSGYKGEPFVLLKIRTMRPPAHAAEAKVEHDFARLTTVGRFLRSTSLDELPELWNVVRGDMNLIGPRPLPTEYFSRFTAAELRRHDVYPGITGLAQVSGRNAIDWEDKLRFDLQYVSERSLRLDLSILRRTLMTVLRREGVLDSSGLPMPEFRRPTEEA
jgi:lipopolysaccharide/colanic/teichoic acid biosynthesis glycosyltransferase